MKKLKLFLVFVLLMATALSVCSCVDLSAYGISIPGLTAQSCTIHRDLDKDTVCDVCGAYVAINCPGHQDLNHDGKCDTKGCTEILNVNHYDKNHDGKCDEPLCTKSMRVEHEDENSDGVCDVCGEDVESDGDCYDDDGDGECDDCGSEMPVCKHVDSDTNGKCDKCGATVSVQPPVSCEHRDANFDGKCDFCKNKIEGAIEIYANGKLNYDIVLADGSTGNRAMILSTLKSELQKLNLDVTTGVDKAGEESEYEIFFGSPVNRGDEYKIDPHQYGANGYAVKIVGTKIIVVSGSEDSFQDAVNAFKESILGIRPETKRLGARYITEAQNISNIQDDYLVSTITLFGKDIKGYTIAANKEDKNAYNTAVALQDFLYRETGYWLEVVAPEQADKSIVIAMQEKNTDREGFYATFTDGKIEFISEYPTVVQKKVIDFFENGLASSESTGTLVLDAEDNFTSDVRYVYYEDFGAKGDGKTDDSLAIRDTHEYANLGGHKVLGGENKTYYIGKIETAITIKTDVDWRNASFIIDDSIITPTDKSPSGVLYRSVSIFKIERSASVGNNFSLASRIEEINSAGGIDASNFTSFNVELGEPMLLSVTNKNHRNYIRYGANANSGKEQTEVVLIDEHGNLDPTTPFMHDFEAITSYTLFRVNEEPITIEGGNFKTKPFKADTAQSYTSYKRGIECTRSNVTFKNVKHYLIEEGSYNINSSSTTDYGCPYDGFFSTDFANNIVYDNCQFAAHIEFKEVGKTASMGSYDISPGFSTNIVYKECYQEDDNFFDKSGQRRWGVMESSYCKNITYLDSKLTRFDAHNGVHNAFIINTEIKYIRINGTGTFLMEDSTMYSAGGTLVGLREDYGGFWDGDIILKNNTMITSYSQVELFTNKWRNHDFGYPARYPTNIIIDGLEIYTNEYKTQRYTAPVYLFGSDIIDGAANVVKDYIPATSDPTVMIENKNQATAPERIIIRNCQNLQAQLSVPVKKDYEWFENTTFSINQETQCTKHFDHLPDGKCDDCGENFTPCTEHIDSNNDGKCCFCNEDVKIHCDKHIDKNLDQKCDICNEQYVCDGHLDADGNTICDKCGGALGCKGAHTDSGKDGYCDVCTREIGAAS